jgi:transcriptional regulator with XRE-family HTH domain
MEIGQRITELLEKKGVTAYTLSNETGVSQGTLSRIINKNTKPNASNLKALSDYFEVSQTWLLTGKEYGVSRKEEAIEILSEVEQYKGVPYYDVEFTSSYLEVENNQTISPTSYINHPFFIGCDMVVRNSGQSMAKLIAHGDAVGLVRIQNWTEFFPLGEVYAIVTTNNFRMIKIITEGKDDEHFTLISKPTDGKKDEFPPQQIKKESILQIFKVQASSHLF